jgi:hypothetical protein
LAYYTDQASYAKEPTKPLGVISLNAYYCSPVEGSASFEFQLNAYPKSLVCRASSVAERDDWVAAVMAPLAEVKKPPHQVRAEEEAAARAATGGAPAAAAAGAGAGAPAAAGAGAK